LFFIGCEKTLFAENKKNYNSSSIHENTLGCCCQDIPGAFFGIELGEASFCQLALWPKNNFLIGES
jgi:hypothetical protein